MNNLFLQFVGLYLILFFDQTTPRARNPEGAVLLVSGINSPFHFLSVIFSANLKKNIVFDTFHYWNARKQINKNLSISLFFVYILLICFINLSEFSTGKLSTLRSKFSYSFSNHFESMARPKTDLRNADSCLFKITISLPLLIFT